MLAYPNFNPIALKLGPLQVHWYGLMYLIGIGASWLLILLRVRKPNSGWTAAQLADLVFYMTLGIIIGGRIGYMLFYDLPALFHNPLSLFAIWQGGMSFHGGLIGVLLAFWLFGRRYQRTFIDITDFIAPVVPIGLAAGRLGNFINGELWGRISNVPWAMVFPNGGPWPRHPSQLYEFLLEGILLFIIMWLYSSKPRPRMAVSALFLIGYGSLRIFCECFRQPDPQYGFIAFGWLTMGQLLSIPMVIAGVIMMYYAYKRKLPSAKTIKDNTA